MRPSEAQPYPRSSTIHEFGNRPDPGNNNLPISRVDLHHKPFCQPFEDVFALPCAYNPQHRTPRPCTYNTVAGMPALLLRLRSPVLHFPRTIRTPQIQIPQPQARRCPAIVQQIRCYAQQPQNPRLGTTTPVPDDAPPPTPKSPFYFEAGYALYAKRPSRPFPPPFLSLPSTSFSEPLSTHHKSRDRRPRVNGEMIRGVTNGDDAVLVSDYFICANDGVGAWATRERGHAA